MTIMGINNEGQLVFSPWVEDTDKLGVANVFNGADSALWINFSIAFAKEIKEFYQELRSSGRLSYDKVIEYFVTRQTKKWSISIYNEDSDFKYVAPLRDSGDATNLYQVRGNGEDHLDYFAKNRIDFCDSKWYGADYADDYISLRIYTPDGDLVIPANANITVTPFSDMYAGVMYRANGTLRQKRAKANTPITFEAPDETFNDTECGIYGASNISSLGDLSPLYCGSLNASKAVKLVELIVGSQVEGYSNPNLHELAVGANKLLKKIDVSNCPNFTNPLAISQCPNIEEIYATGSGITGVELPSSGYLKKVYLPATLTNLTVTNQQYIEEFTLDGYDALTTLRIEKTVNIPVEDIMLNAPNLNRIRLLDVTWEAESEDALRQTIEKFKSCLGLDANGNNTDKAVVTGRVTVPSISDELYNDIYENFPDLVVDDGSGKIYIVNYKDRNGDSLYVTRLAEGEDAFDPIEKGYIDMPAAIETENYKYFFIGWSTIPTNVNKHYIVTAQYRYAYPVKFYTDSDFATLYYTQWITSGENASDPVASGEVEAPTKDGTDDKHYTFTSWSELPTNVTSTVKVYAIYTDTWAVRFYNDDVVVNTQWVLNGKSAIEPVAAGYIGAPTRASTAKYNYTFAGWEGTYTNVIAPVNITAKYNSTIRTYNVYFYNGDTLEQTVENVQYGSSASYTGPTPVKQGVDNPDEYVFKFWNPLPENITGETKCYAVFRFTGYLKDDWATIAANVANGTAVDIYQIGARKEIPFKIGDTSYTADVEIIAYNHDDLADGSGKATLTFFCKDLSDLKVRFNSSNSNVGGWQDSEAREFCNSTLFAAFPEELQAVINEVNKISDGGIDNKTLVTTTDKVWIASYDELACPENKYNLSGQGEAYSLTFTEDNSSRKKYLTSDGTAAGYITRSSYMNDNSRGMILRITNSGGIYSDLAFNYFNIAFGFCI